MIEVMKIFKMISQSTGLQITYNKIIKHVDKGDLNWPMVTYLTLVHIAAIVGFSMITSAHKYTLLLAFILWPVSAIGITAGVHRLWAHRSYKAKYPLRLVLMLANSIANQGSIWHWARDHRVHHKHSETDADPHNAKRGFFFAHMGWLLIKKHPDVLEAGKKLNFDDLAEDSLVVFQKNCDPWFALFMCFIFPGLLCTLWGDNFWHGFWIAGALRYAYVLHITWLVNSAAHLYGDHPYDATMWSAENPIVSYLAVGEGWHNWHHKYPYDYAASEYGIDRQYNLTKLFIDIMVVCGLAYDCKRATSAWTQLKLKRDMDMKSL